jgi:hypothetical protein
VSKVNIMHRGAKGIARRVLGSDSPGAVRIVNRWSSEMPPEKRPFPIHRDGRVIYTWESEIASAATATPAAQRQS